MILGFIGKQRNGKTLLMNSIAAYYEKNGYIVVTNQKKVGYPHIYFNPSFLESKEGIENLKKKLKTDKLILCLDEAHLWIDSRRSKHNTAKSFLITQAGKMLQTEKGNEGHFLYTTQFFGQVDVRMRYNTAFIFEISKHKEGDTIYFKVKTYEPRGDRAFPIKETYLDSRDLFKDNLYDDTEMIDVEN